MHTTIDQLLDRHRGLLLDAYGVLVDQSGPLKGAKELIDRLNNEQRPYALVTNDASRHPTSIAAHHQSLGIDIPAERVVSSGALLTECFAAHDLGGAKTLVLGTEDAFRMVQEAGGVPIGHDAQDPDVIVVADEAGFPLLEGLDNVVTQLVRAHDLGRTLKLMLPNPDLIYPKGGGRTGVAAGAIVHLLEGVIAQRAPSLGAFERLGKPEPRLFDKARALLGEDDLVMVGDQLDTDILGAKRAGMAAALVFTGVGRLLDDVGPSRSPDYTLRNIE